MQELDDSALLREYVERGSGEAFAALVTRHVNKVYSVALRHTRNPHHAEEITQAVFVILAGKARHLSKRVILSGWLYQTARLTAVTFIRGEIRRTRREQEAHMQTILNENESNDAWMQIAPLLDAAMANLNETDRHAVVLRFFDGKSLREVGAALGANEDTARKRVNRALEKLKTFFLKRGITPTTDTISGAISSNAVQAAPVALAKTATVAALTQGATASSSTLTLIKGTLKVMAWSQAKTTAVVSLGILLVGGIPFALYESKEHAAREKDFVAYEVQHRSLLQKLFYQKVNENELKHQLVGAWRMAAAKSWGATNYTYFPTDIGREKIFSLTEWSIIHYDSDSNVVVEARGPYKLKGNVYTETIAEAYGFMAQFRGARPQFQISVDGDKYYQMGLHNSPPIKEMWERVRQ